MLLEGKKALILGVANNRSIAWGITQQFKQAGARLAFSYVNDAIKKRVEPLSEEAGGEFTFKCDVSSDEAIAAAGALVKEKWGDVDILVHSLAFANRDDLNDDFIKTSREGFHLALDVSSYSLIALARAFEPLMHDGSSIMAMTYLGSTRVVPSYNVMGDGFKTYGSDEFISKYFHNDSIYFLPEAFVRATKAEPARFDTFQTEELWPFYAKRENNDADRQMEYAMLEYEPFDYNRLGWPLRLIAPRLQGYSLNEVPVKIQRVTLDGTCYILAEKNTDMDFRLKRVSLKK